MLKQRVFHLKDEQGNYTFCRPGCDTPKDNDPQCVKNLWTWINWGRAQIPEYKECYPWPCVHQDIKAMPNNHKCDRVVSTSFSAGMGTIWDLNIKNGKVGISAIPDWNW